MARVCASFIFCTTICCCTILTIAGILAIGGVVFAYTMMLGSAKVQSGMFVMSTNSEQLLVPIGFFLLLGVIMLGCGVFGIIMCKKIEKKPIILVILAIITIVVGLCLIGAAIACLFFINKVDGLLDKHMYRSLKNAANNPKSEDADEWDNIHESYTCCGITDGGDWLMALNSLNWTDAPKTCGKSASKIEKADGCKDLIQDGILWTANLVCAIVGLAAGALFINALLMLFVGIMNARNPEWMTKKDPPPEKAKPPPKKKRVEDSDDSTDSEYEDDYYGKNNVAYSVSNDSYNGDEDNPKKSKTVIVS